MNKCPLLGNVRILTDIYALRRGKTDKRNDLYLELKYRSLYTVVLKYRKDSN